MSNNCLTCKTRIKADPKWDENGGDFWHCTAVVPVQAFGVMWLENRCLNPPDPRSVGRLINLNLFKEDSAQYKSGTEYDCPLWTSVKE